MSVKSSMQPKKLGFCTTTVAAGKIRNKANEKLQTPPGWLVTKDGLPSTDPHEVSKGGFMTPLGGTSEGSSHKGYGLGLLVEALRKVIRNHRRYQDFVGKSRAGRVTGFLLDAVFLPSPYAAAFGGFVERITIFWWAAGGVVGSVWDTPNSLFETLKGKMPCGKCGLVKNIPQRAMDLLIVL